ncbi:multidrug ABC transporter permease/ATP-binding protein, partial [Salmonella enterica subsp. enterica serovar Typhi]|nr:multidrug ABC transporter permease/ATP-binding protein [Salmonella enterica subsp. enterica serovar Typhi]
QERQAKTTIITTHRMTAVQHADHIIVMEDGYIIEHGTHDELMDLNGWYKEQYITQQTKAESEEVEVQA